MDYYGDDNWFTPESVAATVPEPTGHTDFGGSVYTPSWDSSNYTPSDVWDPQGFTTNIAPAPAAAAATTTTPAETSPLAAVAALVKAQGQPSRGPGSQTKNSGSAQDGNLPPQTADSSEGALSQIMKGLGLDGNLGNPKTLESWMKLLLGGGSILSTLNRKGTAQNAMAPQQVVASLPSQAANKFTPAQQTQADSYFGAPVSPWNKRERAYAADMGNPIVPGRRYAEGGDVMPDPMSGMGPMGGLSATAPFTGFVQGEGGGQDDLVDAQLSPGEYVFDADTVSALGDGDNTHGAKLLDQFRENLRAHKRSADPSSIPPRTGDPSQFMPQGALEQLMGGGE